MQQVESELRIGAIGGYGRSDFAGRTIRFRQREFGGPSGHAHYQFGTKRGRQLGTLGGLVLFGPVGIIVGPVIAALFVTVWELYGSAIQDLFPGSGLGLAAVTEPAPPPDRKEPPEGT